MRGKNELIRLAAAQEQAGDLQAAVMLYRQALEIDGQDADVHNLLGSSQAKLGAFTEAVASFGRATALRPDLADGWFNLGNALRSLGRLEEAAAPYRQATGLAPDRAQAWLHLSSVLESTGHALDAEAAARRAVALVPHDPIALIVLGRALARQARHHDAIACLEQALALQPGSVPVLLELAGMFERWKMPEAAIRYYQRVLAQDPEHGFSLARSTDLKLALCDWKDYDGFVARLAAQIEQSIASGGSIPIEVINLHSMPLPPALAFAVARAKCAGFARSAALCPLTPAAAAPHGSRIRLGYLLPYTSQHSMPLALEPLLAQRDRGRFELYGYSAVADGGAPFSSRFRKYFDRFQDLPNLAPEIAAGRIRDDGIDLLIDTTGHTVVNWLPVLAFRPAPVQIHYLGYSLSSGADFIDYLITDRHFMPPEMLAWCSEQPVYLPHSFMATRPEAIAEGAGSRAEFGLPEGAAVFANFNHPFKFEPSMFAVWMRLLAGVPGSVLWLADWTRGTRENLRREAEARGIAGSRLVFAPLLDHPKHLARLSLADLALDNRYHGGGVTTVDALWAGLPILTLAGTSPAGRLGVSLLSAAGMPELIAASLADYEEMALELATNPKRLRELKAKLAAQRASCALFDSDGYRRALEQAYSLIWENHRAGRPPTRIDVPAPAQAGK